MIWDQLDLVHILPTSDFMTTSYLIFIFSWHKDANTYFLKVLRMQKEIRVAAKHLAGNLALSGRCNCPPSPCVTVHVIAWFVTACETERQSEDPRAMNQLVVTIPFPFPIFLLVRGPCIYFEVF